MSVMDKQVIRQCLSLLPLKDFSCPVLDYRKQKLTAANTLKIFVSAQLLGCDSLGHIERWIRSDEQNQEEFGLSSISKSQLCRTINDLPVELCEALFQAVVHEIHAHTGAKKRKVSKETTPLAIIDSTTIRLPLQLADWTQTTQYRSSIKVHTRLLVIQDLMPYPDQALPSTGNASDLEGADILVDEKDVTYVLDRGYACYKRMERWVTSGIQFIVRVNKTFHAEILEEHPLPEDPFLLKDAIVRFGNNDRTEMKSALRLIEFLDDQGRLYRIATTNTELSAKEIMDIYRHRWLIELFFKWMKQHLKFAKLYSYHPEAVWNHFFLALTAYGLLYLLKLRMDMPQKNTLGNFESYSHLCNQNVVSLRQRVKTKSNQNE